MNRESDFVYVVGKQDYPTGVICEPIKVFLYEKDAQKYCEQKNKRCQTDDFYAYQRTRFYN